MKQAKYLLPLTVGIASLVCQCAGAPKKPPCSYRRRLVKSGKSVSLHDLVPKRPAAFTSSGEGGASVRMVQVEALVDAGGI